MSAKTISSAGIQTLKLDKNQVSGLACQFTVNLKKPNLDGTLKVWKTVVSQL